MNRLVGDENIRTPLVRFDARQPEPRPRQRLTLGESLGPRPFHSSCEPSRITIAHVDEHGPVIVDGPDGPECLVVVWPTRPDGRPDPVAIRVGQVEVKRWLLTDNDAKHLNLLLVDWPDLDRHDVIVTDNAIRPTGGTFRGGRYWPRHRMGESPGTAPRSR